MRTYPNIGLMTAILLLLGGFNWCCGGVDFHLKGFIREGTFCCGNFYFSVVTFIYSSSSTRAKGGNFKSKKK